MKILDQRIKIKFEKSEWLSAGERADSICFWLFLSGYFLFFILYVTGSGKFFYGYPCLFHLITGYYCPGCGGTRAVIALMNGKIVRALCFQPVVPVTFFWSLSFLLTQTIWYISKKKIYYRVRFRIIYLWGILFLEVAQFIVKNVALLYGKDLFGGL